MFSVMSCLFTGVGGGPMRPLHMLHSDLTHCTRTTTLQPNPCDAPLPPPPFRPGGTVRLVSGQSASYWNAFLFETLFRVDKLLDTLPRIGRLPRPDRPSVPSPVNVSSKPNTVPTLSGNAAAVMAKLAVPGSR